MILVSDSGRFPNDRDTHGINTVRMATVWMDDYIDLLYLNRPDLRVSSNRDEEIQRNLK